MRTISNIDSNLILNNIENYTINNESEIIVRANTKSELNDVEHSNNIQLKNILILEFCGIDNTFKPVSIEHFIKRVQALIIEDSKKNKTDIYNTIIWGPLEIKIESSEVFKDGLKINLSTQEYKLLRLFIDNKEKILANEQIINCVWGIAYANTGMLRVAIRRLRSKIDPNNEYLKNIRGKGYILSNL